MIAHSNLTELDVGQDEDVADAFVLQEVKPEVERQSVGKGRVVSELLRDSEGETKPTVEPLATRRTKALVINSSKS
ncbi:hypothetical protein ACFX15_012823 [Malus domestica]